MMTDFSSFCEHIKRQAKFIYIVYNFWQGIPIKQKKKTEIWELKMKLHTSTLRLNVSQISEWWKKSEVR